MEQTLENLSERRDLIMEKMHRIKKAIYKDEANNIHYLTLQQQTIQKSYEEFDSVYNEAVGLVARDRKGEWKTIYLDFETLHADLYVKVQTKIADLKRDDSSRALAQNANASESLPRTQMIHNVPHLQVPLPTFDGKLKNWHSFKCMFQTVMGRYPNESPAIKLYHLKNTLIGNAADKIDQEVIKNNNYDESAWRLWEDAYEDERLIIDTHIDALLDLPKLIRENGDEMRKLVETCTKHVDALKTRELPVEGLSELILINLISKRMDRESRKLWESSLNRGELPSFEVLIDFLKERSRVLQKLTNYTHINHPQVAAKLGQQQVPIKPKQTKMFVQTNKESCPCCSNPHSIYKCTEFKKLPGAERFDKVKKAGLCFNCLRPGHRTVDCTSDQHCKICAKHHHSFLHKKRSEDSRKQTEINQPKNSVEAEKKEEPPAAPEQRIVSCCTQTQPISKQIFLSTAKIVVFGSGNATTTCRALLDCCSESNIITERLAKKLNMQLLVMNPPITICELNGMKTTANKVVHTKVSSRDGEFSAVFDFIVTPSITELPTGKVEIQNWPLPAGIKLTDPPFDVPDVVDVIIGAEIFYDILRKGRVKIGSDFPTLAETVSGWVVSGSAGTKQSAVQRRVCQLATTYEDVNRTLSRFWELEAGYHTSKMTSAERAVEQHFDESHSRNNEGRYVIRLPFNNLKGQLGDSYENAKRRLGRLMVSLTKNPSKREAYTQFMTEYATLGHMQEVSHNPEEGYFLPHHAVYKATSSTTKVVFDASAASTTGISLNDTQLVGPTVQSDLVTIMLRFCTHQVVLIADVPKMYRQVLVRSKVSENCVVQRRERNGYL
ncbi:uncharacterized protein LOC135715715 [Ochlerotatus camptorhynchus]|uniref:uncharacterized protein LOC135715715 n=1 Tax=Ochlerotatus camptorhynchus TaxID=644619 RepID=UPI0031E02BBC